MADAGSIYADMGKHLAHQITSSAVIYHKEHQDALAVQGLLDAARRIQIPDTKTGKPKQFFADDQLMYVQRLIDQKKYKAAGAVEASMGIGKGMTDRILGAAAKQAIAAQSMGGPYQMRDPQGRAYRGNTDQSGVIHWFPDTAKPTNAMGLTAKDQFQIQRSQVKDVNQAQQAQFKADQQAKIAQNKAFSALLKGNGISSPTDLFDPTIQQGGTFSPGAGFTTSTPDPNDPNKYPVPTHIRFYHQPPDEAGGTKGKAGVVLPTSQVVDLQDAAASMAGPQAVQAVQWLRQNPSNEHAEAVRKEIIKRTSEAVKAPPPETFQPSPPSFAPPAPVSQAGAPPQEPVVSDEAAAQNEGY